MTSVLHSQKTVSLDNEFYIPIANATGFIYALNTTTGTLSTAVWASQNGGRFQSSINAAGAGLLRDQGKTYLSGGRTFRKVQLVVPQSTGTVSTGGVSGRTGTTPNEDFLTGYIEVGFSEANLVAGGSATLPSPFAKWGR